MRKTTVLIILSALLISCTGKAVDDIFNDDKGDKAGGDAEQERLYAWEKERTSLLDYDNMVLIYGGGRHRTYKWDEEAFQPYVTYTDEGGIEHWLFDCFLFLEIKDGDAKTFAKGYTEIPANLRDWRNLADYYFDSSMSLGALNRAVGAAMKRMGVPDCKRKVVISIPEPIKGQKDWGSVSDGIMLDFSIDLHRIEACKWYIDYVRSKFNQMNYKHLELAGFYWLAEQAGTTRTIINQVSRYLNELQYTFNWIPYFVSGGHKEWETLGFNYAYLQPNYFFTESLPYSRLTEACQLANVYGMDMEMEFDERVLTGWGYRLKDYMKAFKENGIWQNKRLAYYQGGTALYQLARSSKHEDQELYHEFCKFVVESVKQ